MSRSIPQPPSPETPPTGEDDDLCTEATGHLRLLARVPPGQAGRRFDQVLAELFPDFSRSRLQQWIRDGRVTLAGCGCRPRDKVSGGEEVVLEAVQDEQVDWQPEPLPLSIVHQDDDLLVIDKPAGLVVHPAAGNWDSTLLNGLLYHDPGLAQLPRGGIVHRLDKDTSGLLVVARTLRAHASLVAQLQARTVSRRYLAVVTGVPVAGATVDAPMGRHPTQRTRMAVIPGGKPAVTHYRVKERYRAHALLEVRLETGRTHQIRVHLAHVRFPILGDPVYGGRLRLPPRAAPELTECLRGFRRQALHAERLALSHPATGERQEWSAPIPADMEALIAALRADDEHGGRES